MLSMFKQYKYLVCCSLYVILLTQLKRVSQHTVAHPLHTPSPRRRSNYVWRLEQTRAQLSPGLADRTKRHNTKRYRQTTDGQNIVP